MKRGLSRKFWSSPLRFPSLIVASENDPYATVDYSERRAGQWGSRLIALGPLGHINAISNLGGWPEGRDILKSFRAEIEGKGHDHLDCACRVHAGRRASRHRARARHGTGPAHARR
ncbi:RBBP9/YdeN family alpha/beta hydrolase [Altericroceibacterium endophyticum]|uniref:RBBP9/YdeN family alpha/beta hydrolase n=1 Tax=Altericroceibacterium endophyticum TaxID=1808508 RepID=UPI003B01D843